MIRLSLIGALGLISLLSSSAEARFIMLDASFDSRPLGSSLDRRGARFGEPVPGAGDNHSEVIVADGPGDRSVQIWDTTTASADELTFALVDSREVSDGKIHISLELQPDTIGVYEVVVEGPDVFDLPFFNLVLDGAGFLYWADANDLGFTQFGTYTAGIVMLVEMAFDLDAGTYDFTLDGVPILVDEDHGIVDRGIALLVVGNRFDGNATGSIRLDNPSVDATPGTADPLLLADFNDEPIGQPIGTGGAALGQPTSYWNCVPTVETGITPTPSLQISDEATFGSTDVWFEFLDSVEMTEGDVSVSCWLVFDSLESYYVNVREQGSSAQVFLSMFFVYNGEVRFSDSASGGATYHIETYAPLVPIRVEMAFYTDVGLYSVWLNGERVVHRRAHGIVGRGVGSLIFSNGHDFNLDGRMRVDTIEVHTLAGTLTAIDEGVVPFAAPPLLRAAPNPFNPSTSLTFALPAPAGVRLDVVDVRGRRVRRLLVGDLAAGDHAVMWNGLDDGGQRVASGVYKALLRVDGQLCEPLPLTMVK